MALKNISRSFRDISLSFTRNPITNDIISINNEDAIKKSVMNLVRTQIGERFFNNLIGTSLRSSLFELNYSNFSDSLEEEIRNLLENFEPRVRVKEINSLSQDDSHEIDIEIIYDIVGLPFPTQTIQFILQPSRL
jgi:phage baseplate assembly protein W